MSRTIRRQCFTFWDRDQIGRARSKSINQSTYVDTTLGYNYAHTSSLSKIGHRLLSFLKVVKEIAYRKIIVVRKLVILLITVLVTSR